MFFSVNRLSVSIQSIFFWPSVPTYAYYIYLRNLCNGKRGQHFCQVLKFVRLPARNILSFQQAPLIGWRPAVSTINLHFIHKIATERWKLMHFWSPALQCVSWPDRVWGGGVWVPFYCQKNSSGTWASDRIFEAEALDFLAQWSEDV
jgi:hypothetical protein